MNKCKWCLKEFDLSDKSKGWMANHVRWCNPNKNTDFLIKVRQEKKNFENQFTKAKSLGIKIFHASKGKKCPTLFRHSKETIEKIRIKALNSNHRRLRKNMINYNGIMLDSSWELALAERLDELKIKWTRPSPLKWEDDEKKIHNYFPDFYLVDYNIFLDPKNPIAFNVQKKKIEKLEKKYDNIFFILTLEQCKNFNLCQAVKNVEQVF